MNNSLKDRLVRHMEDGHYEPQSKSELARALNVDSRQKQDFRAIVEVLPGQLVSVEPVSRGEEKKAPRGKIVEVLGYPDDPHVDMEAVIRKYDLPVEFPRPCFRRWNSPFFRLGRREDWTDRTVITIGQAPGILDAISHHGHFRLDAGRPSRMSPIFPAARWMRKPCAAATPPTCRTRVLPMLPPPPFRRFVQPAAGRASCA